MRMKPSKRHSLGVGIILLIPNLNIHSEVYQLFLMSYWHSARASIESAFSSAICQEARLTPKSSAKAARAQPRLDQDYFMILTHADTSATMAVTEWRHRLPPIVNTESSPSQMSRKHTSARIIRCPLWPSGHSMYHSTNQDLCLYFDA